MGQVEMMPVAGREIGTRLGDADDRLSGAQFLAGQAEIEVALEIERGHARIVGIVEPQPGAQGRRLRARGRLAGHAKLPDVIRDAP
jgi:hypothetical protein